MDVAHSLRVLSPGIAEGSTICGTNVKLRERPAGYFMLRCDRQDLTLQAILSKGSLLPGRPLGECSAQWPPRGRGSGGRLRRAWLRTVEQHPAAADAFTPRSGCGQNMETRLAEPTSMFFGQSYGWPLAPLGTCEVIRFRTNSLSRFLTAPSPMPAKPLKTTSEGPRSEEG